MDGAAIPSTLGGGVRSKCTEMTTEDPCLRLTLHLGRKANTHTQFVSTQCGGCFEMSVQWEHEEEEEEEESPT